MKVLKDILTNVSIVKLIGDDSISINELQFDSRNISSNDVFFALKGMLVNGHDYIEKAINLGAKVIVLEDQNKIINTNNICYVLVKNTHSALATIAANYFGNPSDKLKLVGVTGTNGKTTIATLLYQLYQNMHYKVGLLSTVAIFIDKEEFKTFHTTPDSITINRYLSQMVAQGVTHCFMEVSSHGIHQKRTEGLHFEGGIFTNLSLDHLDYHQTFSAYRDIKKEFFDSMPKTSFSLVNVDDKNGEVMLQNTKSNIQTYALKTVANFKTKIIENHFNGLLLEINQTQVWTRLIGAFNAYNLTAIYATAILLGEEKTQVLTQLSKLQSVSGRFQYVIGKNGVKAIVDYAHTPDALKNVLQTINEIKQKDENVITVVGCGGDRDKTKRPIMANIATQLSQQVIFTSDNPRTENPESIIEEMESGVSATNVDKYLSITNRLQAIKTANKLAKKGDILLIAGKGHENYQEINGERTEFDDFKIINQLINQK